MQLNRYLTTSFFTLSGNTNTLFYITGTFSGNAIDHSAIFGYNFVCLFFIDGYNNTQLNSAQPNLDAYVSVKKGFSWITANDAVINLSLMPSLGVDNQSNCQPNLSTSNLDFSVRDAFGKIAITANSNGFVLTCTGSVFVFTEGFRGIEFSNATIRLDTEPGSIVGGKVSGPATNRIQPASFYIDSSNNIVNIDYFDQNSFNALANHSIHYYPYSTANLVEHATVHSYMSHLPQGAGIISNVLDKNGNPLAITADFISKLSIIEYQVGSNIYTMQLFIPMDNYAFAISSPMGGAPSIPVMIGYSGSEYIDLSQSGIINFVTFPTLRSDPASDSLQPSLRSLTSVPTFAADLVYSLDAERAPLFNNTGSSSPQQVDYAPIMTGYQAQQKPVPIIPMLSFTDNPSLLEIEKLFVKYRVSNRKLTSTSHTAHSRLLAQPTVFITPQGFLKNGLRYNFINPTASVSFIINDIHGDIDASLRKDQVFFVLTPGLMKTYAANGTLVAKFALNPSATTGAVSSDISFYADLTASFYDPSVTPDVHGESIIVFKFCKGRAADLLNDTSLWSNYGLQLGDQKTMNDIKSAVNIYITQAQISDPYFTDSVLGDENWNGIFILNVPAGSSIPAIFEGLASSQNVDPSDNGTNQLLSLQTPLNLKYAAFPVNKTKVNGNAVGIVSTSFYGLIDYDVLSNPTDFTTLSDYFSNVPPDVLYRFALTRLKVRFANSAIVEFSSYAFLHMSGLFEDTITFDAFPLSNDPAQTQAGTGIQNLLRLDGLYQATPGGGGEFSFSVSANSKISFNNVILNEIDINRIGFNYFDAAKKFAFVIDGKVLFSQNISQIGNIFSFNTSGLSFQNIFLTFSMDKINIPLPSFDLSGLIVLPNFDMSGGGFLSSFPIKFSHFQIDPLKMISIPGGKFNLDFPDLGFLSMLSHLNLPSVDGSKIFNLFSFVFDFDLGTLGDLGGLKGLGGQIQIGWTFKEGLTIGLKLSAPSIDGLHIDLFGALKLDINQVALKRFNPGTPGSTCSAYVLWMQDVRLTIFGTELPGDQTTLDGLIIANFAAMVHKVAWLLTLKDNTTTDLLLGIGNGVGVQTTDVSSVMSAIDSVATTFDQDLSTAADCTLTIQQIPYKPDRNWLIASQNIFELFGSDWADLLKIAFIFNDPDVYGLYVGLNNGLLAGFSVDILYKKISDNIGVYALDLQLPDSIRSHDVGSAFFRLPDFGIAIYTNGDWKLDIGFPTSGSDWSRSGFLQLRTVPPLVGWFGTYLMESRIASLTLFKGYIDDTYSQANLNIIQFGFGMRVGLGAYIDGGIFYAGASITVFGLLEGAAAFEKNGGLSSMFPDHFAVLGRVGAVAEVIGYVDFGILKASVHISLSAEFGLLLVYLSKAIGTSPKGLQPVKIYIQGNVTVEITISIGCVHIHLSFGATLRFEYTIGGSNNSGSALFRSGMAASMRKIENYHRLALQNIAAEEELRFDLTAPVAIAINNIKTVPMAYLPAYTMVNENGTDDLRLISSFVIPFFGKSAASGAITFSDTNILKDSIIKGLFQDLLAGLTAQFPGTAFTYEDLRSIFLDGTYTKQDGSSYPIELSFPSYLPTLVKGINSTDISTVKNILTNSLLGFGFTAADVAGINAPIAVYFSDPDPALQNDPLLLIPAPIGTTIQVADQNYNGHNPLWASSVAGFNVNVNNLVQTSAGNPAVTFDITQLPGYDAEYVDSYFDSYKTQFVDDQAQNAGAMALPLPNDARSEIIIPEFFKLIGLLTLESFYATIPKYKTGDPINPLITGIDGNGIFQYNYVDNQGTSHNGLQWNPNSDLKNIVGQLNYFYSSGLRLPIASGSPVRSIFDTLNQSAAIAPIAASSRNPATVSVTLGDASGSVDITTDVFADNNAVNDAWAYIDGFAASTFGLAKLKAEFSVLQFTKPYNLVPVTLAVQKGKLNFSYNTGAGTMNARFFEMPSKLCKQSSAAASYAYNLNIADNNSDPTQPDVVIETTDTGKTGMPLISGFRKMLNIEVSAKVEGQILEITTVGIDDLNLIDILHNDAQVTINNIRCFYKPDAAASSQAAIQLQQLGSSNVSILKANLSPRTYPPTIMPVETALMARIATTSPQYYADSSTDQENFIRLTWEALTCNNGGYYLVPDNYTLTGVTDGAVITLILSFETGDTAIPEYFNAFSLDDQGGTLAALDNHNSYYLYLDGIVQNGQGLLEYHPTIPAHTFGFDLTRDTSVNANIYWKSNYNKYLPLEFELTSSNASLLTLSYDQVMPIMPQTQTDPATGKAYLGYHHISPLVKVTDASNQNRYAAVGSTIALNLKLRDTYGFRTGNNVIGSGNYTHCYTDKLVPVSAWPLIKCSYWFSGYSANNLEFAATCGANILDILDMAGIARVSGQYAYDLSSVDKRFIRNADDATKIDQYIEKGLASLYTVYAQLLDTGVSVTVTNYAAEASNPAKTILACFIKQLIQQLLDIQKVQTLPGSAGPLTGQFLPAANIPAAVFNLVFSPADPIKNLLDFSVTIQRNNYRLDMVYAELNSPNVWDYDTTYVTINKIKPQNSGSTTATKLFSQLNDAIRTATSNKFGLGISSLKPANEKVLYLINEAALAGITAAPNFIDPATPGNFDEGKCYVGIKPFSNQLWSGGYKNQNFTNVDMDKCLNVILKKIDELLQSDAIESGFLNNKTLYDQLMAAKLSIANNVLNQKIGPVSAITPANPGLISQFSDILLEKLDNFYLYDGAVNAGVTGINLGGNRLNVTLADQPGYNLVSSKIDSGNQWSIFFDQKANSGPVGLQVIPSVTHIEFDIVQSTDQIEESTWIQLITPVQFATYKVDNWPLINRAFPAKPVIATHSATQKNPDGSLQNWDIAKVGLWNYQLGIVDNYDDGDIIHVDIAIQFSAQVESLLSTPPDLRPFIAYWSAMIAGTFVWTDFVADLNQQLSLQSAWLTANRNQRADHLTPASTPSAYSFDLIKTGSTWAPANVIGLTVQMAGSTSVPTVKIGDFDVFSTNRVISILPSVKVFRNKNNAIQNPDFLYETDTVQPPNPVTPHIRYFSPLVLPNATTTYNDKVFTKISLPFKATAKYLVKTDSYYPSAGHMTLPTIPIRQFEYDAGAALATADNAFSGYNNGYPSYSLTIYNNQSVNDSDLPMFYVDSITKI